MEWVWARKCPEYERRNAEVDTVTVLEWVCTQAIAGDIQSIQPQLQPVLYPSHCWDCPSYNLYFTQAIAGTAPATTCVVSRPLLGQPQVQPALYPGHCWDSPSYNLCCTQAIAGTAPATTCCTRAITGTATGTTCCIRAITWTAPATICCTRAITGTATGTTCVVPRPLLGTYSTAPASTCVVPRPLLGQPHVQPVLYPGHCWDSPRYNQCCTHATAGDLQHSPSYIQYTAVDATSRAQELCVKVEVDVLGSRP